VRKSIAEVLAEAAAVKGTEAKINVLRQNDSSTLRMILTYAYDPLVKWLLPEGKPPYKRSDFHDGQGVLFHEARRLYLFIDGGNPNLKQSRREMLFVNLLESVDPADAELLCAVKDKKLPHKSLTPALIRKAFPGLLSDDKPSA
jgi:Family of unknown function (DUF6433)